METDSDFGDATSGFMQQAALEGLRKEIDTMVPRVQQVIRQTKARILGGRHSYGGRDLQPL